MTAEAIQGLERNRPFFSKLQLLVDSAVAVRNPLPPGIVHFIHEPYDVAFPRENGTIENIQDDFFQVIRAYPDINWTKMSLRVSPEGRRVISKSAIESAFGVFTDQKNNTYGSEYVLPNLSTEFVKRVMSRAEQKYQAEYPEREDGGQIPLLLSEQFAIALNLSKGNIFNAVLAAHFGSRAIARGEDTHCGLSFTAEEMKRYRQCVGFMEELYRSEGRNTEGKNIGDTYHFFGGMLGGLMCSTINKPYDVVFNIGYALIHNRAEPITKIVDRSDCVITHGPVDRAGFSIGKAIARRMGNRERLVGE